MNQQSPFAYFTSIKDVNNYGASAMVKVFGDNPISVYNPGQEYDFDTVVNNWTFPDISIPDTNLMTEDCVINNPDPFVSRIKAKVEELTVKENPTPEEKGMLLAYTDVLNDIYTSGDYIPSNIPVVSNVFIEDTGRGNIDVGSTIYPGKQYESSYNPTQMDGSDMERVPAFTHHVRFKKSGFISYSNTTIEIINLYNYRNSMTFRGATSYNNEDAMGALKYLIGAVRSLPAHLEKLAIAEDTPLEKVLNLYGAAIYGVLSAGRFRNFNPQDETIQLRDSKQIIGFRWGNNPKTNITPEDIEATVGVSE